MVMVGQQDDWCLGTWEDLGGLLEIPLQSD